MNFMIITIYFEQWHIEDSVRGGGKFLLATSAHTKGGQNHVFLFFPMENKQIFLPMGDHGLLAPLNTPSFW